MLVAAGFAGFVDAIVGGGGLIQVPALLAYFPQMPPAEILGTNKLGSICGAASAAFRFSRFVRLPWLRWLPALGVAFVAALFGARLVSSVSPVVFRPLVPVVLTCVLLYVLKSKDFGDRHQPRELSPRGHRRALAGIGGIALYDGFFGPGTGSFLMLYFVRVYGFDFLHAAAAARVFNVATNLGALGYFSYQGRVHWLLGLALGGANAAGSTLGALTARRHGARFVRVIFIAVVAALIIKTARDALYR